MNEQNIANLQQTCNKLLKELEQVQTDAQAELQKALKSRDMLAIKTTHKSIQKLKKINHKVLSAINDLKQIVFFSEKQG